MSRGVSSTPTGNDGRHPNRKMAILVVEDEKHIAGFIKQGLQEDGYAVDVAGDGEDGLALAEAYEYEAIVLDLLLPKKDGLTVLRELRQQGKKTPVLILTAKDTVADKVAGLDGGADDYLTKPFSFDELLARLRALLRRADTRGQTSTSSVRVADLSVDLVAHTVSRAGNLVELTSKEFKLLTFLMRHSNQVLTRNQIESQVWGYDFDGGSNVVDVYIRMLRKKIDEGYEPKLIHTVRGTGYMLKASAEPYREQK